MRIEMNPRAAALVPAVLAAALTATAAGPARGDVAHDEAVGGDLSGAPGSPTPVTLRPGTQSVIGTLRTTAAGDNQDWLAVTVPAGLQVQGLVQAAYASTDAIGFTGFQFGPTFAGPTNDPASYAGYTHFGSGLNGADLLQMMDENSPGATGFTRPLGPGTYTFLIQQTGTSPTAYQFDFQVVPEPAAAAGLLTFAAAAALRRTRRDNRPSPPTP